MRSHRNRQIEGISFISRANAIRLLCLTNANYCQLWWMNHRRWWAVVLVLDETVLLAWTITGRCMKRTTPVRRNKRKLHTIHFQQVDAGRCHIYSRFLFILLSKSRQHLIITWVFFFLAHPKHIINSSKCFLYSIFLFGQASGLFVLTTHSSEISICAESRICYAKRKQNVQCSVVCSV